jgi:hypothetical protein
VAETWQREFDDTVLQLVVIELNAEWSCSSVTYVDVKDWEDTIRGLANNLGLSSTDRRRWESTHRPRKGMMLSSWL